MTFGEHPIGSFLVVRYWQRREVDLGAATLERGRAADVPNPPLGGRQLMGELPKLSGFQSCYVHGLSVSGFWWGVESLEMNAWQWEELEPRQGPRGSAGVAYTHREQAREGVQVTGCSAGSQCGRQQAFVQTLDSSADLRMTSG